MDTFTIHPKGAFSLEEAAQFGFGQRQAGESTDAEGGPMMRLAFCIDGYRRQAGVSVTQAADGTVHGTIWGISDPGAAGPADPDAVIGQVARVLSIDHDATGYQDLRDRDPVIARLMDVAPGLRPPLFYSPYEAALWAVISQRRPRATADQWRARLSGAFGARFVVAGTAMCAAPIPERLVALGVAGVAAAAGIEPTRAERVVGVARAALEGKLDADTISAMSEDQARAELQSIPGIGPFYADLIVIRATGVTDMLPLDEPRLFGLVGELYGVPGPVTPKAVERVAEAWRPWRTWVSVLVRSAGPRLLARCPNPLLSM
jgi:DNA-3-methyladenine glycosylase II